MSAPQYHCATCGWVLLVNHDPAVRCIAPHHCHTGEAIEDDGRIITLVAAADCEPVSVNGQGGDDGPATTS